MPPEQLDLPGTDFEGVRPKRRPSRGMYLLPSLLTAANIAAGYYGITQRVQGTGADPSYFDHAALAIGLAAPPGGGERSGGAVGRCGWLHRARDQHRQ